jgi:hypothetical protein
MEIPKKIRVGAYTYKVMIVDKLVDEDAIRKDDRFMLGQCDSNKLEIYILRDQSKIQQASTFVHEVLEAINEHYGIGLKHKQIQALECGLMQVFFT